MIIQNNNENTYPITNEINIAELWKGIGGHFNSLNQILHEIIDNSISNFKSNEQLNHHTILISIRKLNSKEVEIFIEDTGTGIKNIDHAFTLGNKESQESPLNEHGFGLKHALATANPNNDNWTVYTRTEELVDLEKVSVIESPYQIKNYCGKHLNFNFTNYPTKLNNYSTGTIVRFVTSFEMYKTLGKNGIKDSRGIALYLKEDLGFIYSGIINSNIAQLQIIVDDDPKIIVNSVLPSIDKILEPGSDRENVDLGLLAGEEKTGNIIINYKFCLINDRIALKEDEKIVYYKTNMKSSGVEIRINGRMIKNNILNEIWENYDQHNRFNKFLIQIDLESDNLESLPETRSSKNDFKQGDIKLLGLYNWIRKYSPTPYEDKNERDVLNLFDELKIIKENQYGQIFNPLTVITSRRIFKSFKENLKIDLYLSFGNETIIYSGTKTTSTVNDLYMLKLYWDACVIEGTPPTCAILLASEHSQLVQDLTSMNNDLKDILGNKYKLILKKWEDENIDHPKRVK